MYSVVEGVFIYVVIALCQQYLAVLLCWLPWRIYCLWNYGLVQIISQKSTSYLKQSIILIHFYFRLKNEQLE